MIDFFVSIYNAFCLIYMQLRCNTELSANYIISLYMKFFKIYDKNIIYALFKK